MYIYIYIYICNHENVHHVQPYIMCPSACVATKPFW